MNTKLLCVLAASLIVQLNGQVARGALGIWQSYVVVNVNGGGNVTYDAGAATGNPDYQNASFGNFNPSVNSLILNGGEVKTYKNSTGNVFGT